MTKIISGSIYWTPRILAIALILFLMLFSLDVISSESSLKEIAIGLLIHNLPALVLLIVLVISWKYEIVGGVIFILAGLFYVVYTARVTLSWKLLSPWIAIAGPAMAIGVLFLVNWFKKK